MLLAHVVLDVAVEHISGGVDALLHHDATKGDHGDLGGASTYVNHHVASRRLDVETDTKSRGHRLVDEIDIPASGVFAGVTHGTDLHLRASGRDSHHNLEVRCENGRSLVVDLLDESLDHHLGGVEVRDHAVPERPDCLDSGICVLVHELGLPTDRDAFARVVVYRDNARRVQHNLVIPENDGVGRSKIHCYLLSQK